MIKNIFKKVHGFTPVELVIVVGFAALVAGSLIFLATSPSYQAGSQPINVNVKLDGLLSRQPGALAQDSYQPAIDDPSAQFAFEILAKKDLTSSSKTKLQEIDDAVDALISQMDSMLDIDLKVSECPKSGLCGSNLLQPMPDRFGYAEPMYNMIDGTEEYGKGVSFSFKLDDTMIKSAGMEYLLAFPWTISVYTDGSDLLVIAPVPETMILTMMGDSANTVGMQNLSRLYHTRIRELVRGAFQGGVWQTDLNTPLAPLNDQVISIVEGMTQQPLTVNTIGPVVNLGVRNIEEVVNTIHSVITDTAKTECQSAPGISPGMLTGQEVICNEMTAPAIWGAGKTVKQWFNTRVLDLSSPQLGKVYNIELCQELYGRLALGVGVDEGGMPGAGIHHGPIVPVNIMVWQNNKGEVMMKLFDPMFFFPYFFFDTMYFLMQNNPEMFNYFYSFLPFVHNEIITMLNTAFGELGHAPLPLMQ